MPVAILVHRLINKVRKMVTALSGIIVNESECRHATQHQALAQHMAQISSHIIENMHTHIRFRTQYRDKHLGQTVVTRHIDTGNSHHSQLGIADLAGNQLGQITLDLLANTACTTEFLGHEFSIERKV